jgi:hypothetical protein
MTAIGDLGDCPESGADCRQAAVPAATPLRPLRAHIRRSAALTWSPTAVIREAAMRAAIRKFQSAYVAG